MLCICRRLVTSAGHVRRTPRRIGRPVRRRWAAMARRCFGSARRNRPTRRATDTHVPARFRNHRSSTLRMPYRRPSVSCCGPVPIRVSNDRAWPIARYRWYRSGCAASAAYLGRRLKCGHGVGYWAVSSNDSTSPARTSPNTGCKWTVMICSARSPTVAANLRRVARGRRR